MQKKEIVEIIPSREMMTGPKDAQIKLVLFGDYESPETKTVTNIIRKLIIEEEGDINFTFRHFPMTSKHQKAHKAAEAAIGAGQEGKFWEMHDQLLSHPRELGIISLKAHAREVGVKNKHFLDQLMNGTFGWSVQDDLKYGIKLGVKEIPALYINDVAVEGDLTMSKIKTAIINAGKLVRQMKKIRA